MSDSDLPPPPPLSPPSDERGPREPAGGSLKLGVRAATGLGLAAFLSTYALTPSPDVGGGISQTAEAWLTFTFAELPLLLVIAAVLLCIRRTRAHGRRHDDRGGGDDRHHGGAVWPADHKEWL